jgi:hypothetical protein
MKTSEFLGRGLKMSNLWMGRDSIKDEIQLTDSECCIVFDFGCYFPYSNFNILTFGFSLGMEGFNDYKINHRYPNKGYQTISKKYGRKVSKIGYPYTMKLNEQFPILLCLKVGIKNQYITLVFLLKTNMTKDKPICSLELNYDFDKNKFYFMSHAKAESEGWYRYIWRSHEDENDEKGSNDILLSSPRKVDDNSYTLLYDDIIEPCPSSLSELLL